MRATSPSGDADFIGEIGWSNELGHGLRAAEPKQETADKTVRTISRDAPPAGGGHH
jgi:NADH-quinone oxidoreductase subunit I